MLKTLSIKNFALIDSLEIDFFKGMSVITGETGSGKSILLGALGLVLGNRADISSIKNTDKKCIVEVEFNIDKYNLESLFDSYDIDFEVETTIRREILPNGKSRAFVNDTPVTLKVLNDLGVRLIDIHSQNQTLAISNEAFQFNIIDALANTTDKIKKFKTQLTSLKGLKKDLGLLVNEKQENIKDQEYNLFLYNELVDADLKEDEQEILEEELEALSHIENIKEAFDKIITFSNHEEVGVVVQLNEMVSSSQKIASISSKYADIFDRLSSVSVEFDDIIKEVESLSESLTDDPQRLDRISTKLQLIYSLQQKHHVATVKELCVIREDFASKVVNLEAIDDKIKDLEDKIDIKEQKLKQLGEGIEKLRKKVIPNFTIQAKELFSRLGMVDAQIAIELKSIADYNNYGMNTIAFLFSANKGSKLEVIKKVASGGELSRVMLVIKSILARYSQLPTIIFDEIDTGVSGDIANKMGEVMCEMSEKMQVFSITHLPQVAAQGSHHFKVFKSIKVNDTVSELKMLNDKERILEIAEMLSGKDITETALIHAKSLLN